MGEKYWLPTIAKGPKPIYARLAESIAQAIATGELAAGDRLPPHRELAWRRSISVGSVTRAYEDLTRRGLIEGVIGRGSFVVDPKRPALGPIDLSRNVPPTEAARAALRETMALSKVHADWLDGLDYGPPAGSMRDRSAAARWLRSSARLELPTSSALFCTNGAHTALHAALAVLLKPGDALICESATYTGLVALAEQFGYRLCPCALDEQGMRPDELDRVASETGSSVVFLVPTLQNPTARIMSEARRREIAQVARRRKLWVIEDDIYGAFAREAAPLPIANQLPESTLYLSSLSKTIAPGLRTGYFAIPASLTERATRAIGAIAPTQAGLGQAIATHWAESGQADEILDRVLSETRSRVKSVTRILGRYIEKPHSQNSLHLWWPIERLQSTQLTDHATRHGVVLNKPDIFAVTAGAGPIGIRICVGGAATRAEIEKACAILADFQSASPAYSQVQHF